MPRFGLPREFLLQSDVDLYDVNAIFQPPETVRKAGFERGPKAGHKYWRRQRVLVAGKLSWRYYYNTPEDRAAWIKDREELIRHHRHQLSAHKQRLHDEAHSTDDSGGRLRSDYHSDLGLKREQRRIRDLTKDFIVGLISDDAKTQVKISPTAMSLYLEAATKAFEAEDPLTPEGWQNLMHPLRVMETGLRAYPPEFLRMFAPAIKSLEFGDRRRNEIIHDATGKAPKVNVKEYAGVACPNPDGTQVIVNTEYVTGQQYGVSVFLHELAHSFQHGLQHKATSLANRGYTGASWADWVKFLNAECSISTKKDQDTSMKSGRKGGEGGITPYAETNSAERWAESIEAAITRPHDLALKCPKTYDWLRQNFMPAGMMRPRITDEAKIAELDKKIAAASTFLEKKELRAQRESLIGLDRLAATEVALQWWLPESRADAGSGSLKVKEGLVAAQSSLSPTFAPVAPTPLSVYRVDPANEDAVGPQGDTPHDRFYEINHKGRTVFFRYGPTSDGDFTPYETAASPTFSGRGDSGSKANLKEAFDESGNPINPNLFLVHLLQDEFTDESVLGEVTGSNGKKVNVTVDDLNAVLTGQGDAEAQDRVNKLIGSEGSKSGIKFLRAFVSTQNMTAKMSKIQELHGQLSAAKTDAEREKIQSQIDALTTAALGEDRDPTSAKDALYTPVTMMPSEMSLREYKQRSGTFAYDRFTVRGQDALDRLQSAQPGTREHAQALDEFRKAQPGVAVENRRDRATGKFTRGNVMLDAKGRPIMDRIRYENENPDGSKTVIDTVRDPKTGSYRIANPMWAGLLTPNGEEIRSPEDLATRMMVAASEKRRTWISLRTDRKRVQKGGRWTTEKAGDTAHYYHIEVEFDGRGQPRILGDHWKQVLGKAEPRLDHLITDDPLLTQFRGDARAVIQGDAIRLRPEKVRESLSKSHPEVGETFVMAVTAAEQRSRSAQAKDVVVRLTKIIRGKAAGELPSPPGWDRMPEGVDELKVPDTWISENDANAALRRVKNAALRNRLLDLKKRGLLPSWYSHTPDQAAWFTKSFAPAYAEWDTTKEARRQEEYETQYLFTGAEKGGAVNQVFSRGESKVLKGLRTPAQALVPDPLPDHPLAYMHHSVDPRTGLSVANEIRLLAPKGRTVDYSEFPGVTKTDIFETNEEGKRVKAGAYYTVKPDQFHLLRDKLGGLSLTDDVNLMLEERAEMLKTAAIARKEESHVIGTEEIQPDVLKAAWGVNLNETLPNGQKFTLGVHQQRLLQKLLDNNGRVLAAHYMGTGKTVSALVAAQMMLRRPYRADPGDRVGSERQKFLDENPWDPSRLHPDNPKRILIVAPLNTVEQWRQAGYDFDGGAQVVGSGSNDIPINNFVNMPDDQRSEIVVVGPEYFTLHADALKKCGFDGLIIDEVHQGIKNEDAQRNAQVRAWNSDMKMLMLLTGTPMTTSPSDFVEYIRILSEGKVFGDMTTARFIEEYCQESDVPLQEGLGLTGPKVKIKPEKMAELSAILDQYMDIAMPKDVQGKTLPAIHQADNQHASMYGIQEGLYNHFMAQLSQHGLDFDLTPEEIEKLSNEEQRRQASAARSIVNCIGYRPGDTDTFLSYQTTSPSGGLVKMDFETFNPDKLMEASRGKSRGKWPTVDEVPGGQSGIAFLDAYCQDVLRQPYSVLAGKPIGYGFPVSGVDDPYKLPVTDAQRKAALKAMRDAGWPSKIRNPDAGPLGIVFRGSSTPLLQKMSEQGDMRGYQRLQIDIDKSQEFQRDYRRRLKVAELNKKNDLSPDDILDQTAAVFGIDHDEAMRLLSMNPNPIAVEAESTLQHSGKDVVVPRNKSWVSDPRGSLHLLYRPEDWDSEKNLPKSAGGFDSIKPRDFVVVNRAALSANGIQPPDKPVSPPKTASKTDRALYREELDRWQQMSATWTPPKMQWTGVPPNAQGNVPVQILDGDRAGQEIMVPAKAVTAQVRSLMDPGMRDERHQCDLAMTHQNAKCEELEAHLRRFHDGAETGPDGERQVVIFGNGILDSCRTVEAKLRQMGYRDVNEVLEGSPHYDPDDPDTQGDPPGPIGKYFVTYIGSTYTGNRELNVAIFQKVKDKLNRDSKTSLFVHKISEGASSQSFRDDEGNRYSVAWQAYPGDVSDAHLADTDVGEVRMSQWTPDQRATIKAQFGIDAPESFLTIESNGTERRGYFYGKEFSAAERKALEARLNVSIPLVRSGDLLRAIILAGDPKKLSDRIKELTAQQKGGANVADKIAELTRQRAEIVRDIAAIKRAYTEIARANSTDRPPMTSRQISVFNNCEIAVASDAAQVGINWGNASEMVQYDSLGSPMAEDQRKTRCARMLPGAIPESLMGKRRMIAKTRVKRDPQGNPVMEGGKPVTEPVTRLTDSAREQVSILRSRMDLDGTPEDKRTELQAQIDKITRNPDNREVVMVQETDSLGRPLFESDGPFSRLRQDEPDLFAVGARSYNPGSLERVRTHPSLGTDPLLSGTRAPLNQVVNALKDRLTTASAQLAGNAATQSASRRLAQVAARAQAASAKGTSAMLTFLEEMRKEPYPDTSRPILSWSDADLSVPDPAAGTYGGGEVVTDEVIGRVRDWISRQDDQTKNKILSEGFTSTSGGASGSHDAASIYLAIRGQEILTWIEDNRSTVAEDMRSQPGGGVVTETEVMNRLIEMLSPADRAILKEKKYLVNVRKLSAGGNVGQVTPYSFIPEGETRKQTTRVFTGYEREYPIASERRTRATQRSRARSHEEIMHAIQQKVQYRPEGGFTTVGGGDVATLSEIPQAVAKALRTLARAPLVFDLRKLEETWRK